jgi:hypothetical protein
VDRKTKFNTSGKYLRKTAVKEKKKTALGKIFGILADFICMSDAT